MGRLGMVSRAVCSAFLYQIDMPGVLHPNTTEYQIHMTEMIPFPSQFWPSIRYSC